MCIFHFFVALRPSCCPNSPAAMTQRTDLRRQNDVFVAKQADFGLSPGAAEDIMPGGMTTTIPHRQPGEAWPREAATQTNAGAERAARELRRTLRASTPPAVPGHELLRIIGMGAYGEVWLARAETGAYHAVKVVWREDFQHQEFYEQEYAGTCFYEPLSRNNYGLVPILQVGHHGRDYFFCVMELADDVNSHYLTDPEAYSPSTLQSVMSRHGRHPIALDPVIGTGLHLAHGLARLHEAGLAHGDIKPSNIVYIQGQPRLADAGTVAHPGQHRHSGTVGYIPPEGAGSKQADVYALALVLYEMATGCDRYDFPALPAGLPEGNERWLAFNRVICAAADPSPTRRRITTATQLGQRLEALRHPPVFPPAYGLFSILLSTQFRRALPQLAWLATAAMFLFGILATMALLHLLPDGFFERLPRAWEVLMNSRA